MHQLLQKRDRYAYVVGRLLRLKLAWDRDMEVQLSFSEFKGGELLGTPVICHPGADGGVVTELERRKYVYIYR